MNRRTYFKSIFILAGTGALSFSIFKWYGSDTVFNASELENKRAILAELAETIIPATDTPGAKAAGIHNHIIKVVTNCSPEKEQIKFLSGIIALEKDVKDRYGKDFLHCSAAEKNEIVRNLAEHVDYPYQILNKISRKLFGASFYTTLRHLTIEGFCLSKPGATEALAYDYIPGRFDACVPIKSNQKSWATK
jgi:hypothetical protein